MLALLILLRESRVPVLGCGVVPGPGSLGRFAHAVDFGISRWVEWRGSQYFWQGAFKFTDKYHFYYS